MPTNALPMAERAPHEAGSPEDRPFKRGPVASLIFRLLRPDEAWAAALGPEALHVTGRQGRAAIEMRRIGAVFLEAGWLWGAVRVRTAAGETIVSGIRLKDAAALAAGIDVARTAAWRRLLAEHAEAVGRVAGGIAALGNPPAYVRRSAFAALIEDARRTTAAFPAGWPESVDSDPEVAQIRTIRAFLAGDLDRARERANEAFVPAEIERSRGYLDYVEARPLTDEQRRAVCIDDDRNLVVAAAGSGKTSVMVAKAGWLVARGDRRPSDLLLLAFARNARDELAERLQGRLGERVAAGATLHTFHSLGLAIIGRAEGRRPALAGFAGDPRAFIDLVRSIAEELIGDPVHGRELVNWLVCGATPYRNQDEFTSWGEYWDYIQSQEVRSLQGERVRSLEECYIANFLYLNGVAYEYEGRYEHETATEDKGPYRPDFHLSESGIYIEHFALGRDGRTPPFIDCAQYTRERKWKRELHRKHGTRLIETFSHEARPLGRLEQRLAAKLKAEGVELKPIGAEETLAAINKQGRVPPFAQMAASFLQHFKGARLSLDELEARAARVRDGGRTTAFVRVFRPIFERYQARLSEAGEIDFHDMINRATEHVAAGRYPSPFGYILVDEFQDISPGRAALLEALLGQSRDTQLFAVGDDWQAIFRFAGSDIAVMRSFEERFGAGARSDLETTFRCSDALSDVATRFVLRNPAQIVKTVRTRRRIEGPGVRIGRPGERKEPLVHQALGEIAAETDAEEHDGGRRTSVLLLGRYWHLQPEMTTLRRLYPRLDLTYRTVHRAKGLEADYVVVLGMCSGRYGFPTEIADDPLFDLVLAAPEEHANAEERRLFYVALTRARRRTYLLEEGAGRSPFITELLGERGRLDTFGGPAVEEATCPRCKTGRLVAREAEGERIFYGCSHYPYCDHTDRPCPHCKEGLPRREDGKWRCPTCRNLVEGCPRCDGWLAEKMGRRGPFMGCSTWSACKYTRAAPAKGDPRTREKERP